MDNNNQLNFQDFQYFITNFCSEDLIHKHAERFKQTLIDRSIEGKLDLTNNENLTFVFSEFFLASIMANMEILGKYHQYLLENADEILSLSEKNQDL